MTEKAIQPTNTRVSAKLREIAGDLADIAANPPSAMDSKAMARIASQILTLAGQVYLDELDSPSLPPEPAGEPSIEWLTAFFRRHFERGPVHEQQVAAWVEAFVSDRDRLPETKVAPAPEPDGDVATLKRLFAAECDDTDRLLGRLGLGDKASIAEQYRSEGGFLRGGKIENAIREKLAIEPVAVSGWVIEGAWSPIDTPDYWVGSSAWSPDAYKALRFATLKDAQQAADMMCSGLSVRLCEHKWAEQPETKAAVRQRWESTGLCGCTGELTNGERPFACEHGFKTELQQPANGSGGRT